MSYVVANIIQGAAAVAVLGAALYYIEWKERRDARRHELDLERIRQDQEIARLRAEIERLKGGAK